MRSVCDEIVLLIFPLPSTWEYVSFASADAARTSSPQAPWQDGDTIIITDSPEYQFKYFTALEVNGHNGLIPKYPHNDAREVTGVTVTGSEGAGTDPDTWGSEWVDGTSGTKGVDYDFGTNSGRATIESYTNPTQAFMNNEQSGGKDSDDTNVFTILRNTEKGGLGDVNIFPYAYQDASNDAWISFYYDGNWGVYDGSSSTDSAVTASSLDFLFISLESGDFNFFTQAGHQLNHTTTRTIAKTSSDDWVSRLRAGDGAQSATLECGTVVCGFMTLSP